MRRASTSPKLAAHVAQQRTVDGFAGGEPLTNEQLFALDVDVLIPAALENQITMENAPAIRARVIIEGANGPTTPDAHQHLHDRGVFVVPDILANSAGVTASYFEWVQDRYGYFWTEKEVNERLELKMLRGVQRGSADGPEIQGRHAYRRLHRRDQPRRHRHADPRHVRLKSNLEEHEDTTAFPKRALRAFVTFVAAAQLVTRKSTNSRVSPAALVAVSSRR